ncbi:MAG: ferredoxin [Candidatus Saccharicenans sp.]
MPHQTHGHHPGRLGQGPGGYCFCPKCGYRQEHQPGVPCIEQRCPKCGSALIREGSEHHRLLEEKKAQKNK